jgi:hypothetical protein
MTGAELANLPVGSIVQIDGEKGEIIQAGREVHIIWPESNLTRIVHTESKAEAKFLEWLEAE